MDKISDNGAASRADAQSTDLFKGSVEWVKPEVKILEIESAEISGPV